MTNTEINPLTSALTTIMPFRDTLFSMLGATEISILTRVCRLSMTSGEVSKNLVISRDFDWMMDFVDCVVDIGMKPLLIGPDLEFIRNRILYPMSTGDGMINKTTTLWFVVLSDLDKIETKEFVSMMTKFNNTFVNNPILTTISTDADKIIVTVNGCYPTRIVVQNLSFAMDGRLPWDSRLSDDPDWEMFGAISSHIFYYKRGEMAGCTAATRAFKSMKIVTTRMMDLSIDHNTIRVIDGKMKVKFNRELERDWNELCTYLTFPLSIIPSMHITIISVV